ncbi:MAG: hypothetical protein QOK37_3440 [Thermoanaerobaculia bacterium]|jgi:hypothetical protein|nr:hypothetical protein [Thermoanaerobaculia bacterium]
MPRKQGKSAVKRAGSAIARTARKLTMKLNPLKRAAKPAEKPARVAKPKAPAATARATKRQSDVPIDLLAQSYAPSQTSIKTSFRSDGADHHNDQEIPFGTDERFENEDHFTNRSGDARIGTHGRSYEPGEPRPATTNANRR